MIGQRSSIASPYLLTLAALQHWYCWRVFR